MATGDYLSVLSHGLITTDSGGGADYPDVVKVIDGTIYSNGDLIGTYVETVNDDVRLGVGYGAGGTQYFGTLVVSGSVVPVGITASPARIVQRLLVENGWASDPDLTIVGTWPAYYDNEPDLPDNCITIYDTTPALDSDLMLSGEQTQHEGITIRIRSKDHDVGASMTRQLLKQLTEQVYFKYLTIGSHQYLVQCFAQLSIVRLGRDSKTKRTLHNINGFVAVTMRN